MKKEGRMGKKIGMIAFLSMVALTSCGLLDVQPSQPLIDEWEGAGFTKVEEGAWEGAGFALSDAKAWRKDGFVLSEAAQWHKDGFDPEGASVWKGYGFGDEEAVAWARLVPTPDLAKEWKSAGYEPGSMGKFKGWTQFPPQTALSWYKTGATPGEAGKLIAEGITPKIYTKIIKKSCGKKFYDPLSLITANPYETKGKCSFLQRGMLRVIQFLGKKKALAVIPTSEYYALVYVKRGTVPSSLGYIDGGLIIGEGAFRYVSTMGSEQTVPKILIENFRNSSGQ